VTDSHIEARRNLAASAENVSGADTSHAFPVASERKHVPVLDGLRGVAILLVLFKHFFISGDPTGFINVAYFKARAGGWAGVDLFFVLSGFLITGILVDAKSSPHYFRNFYARRFLRIFPIYFAFLFFLYTLLPAIRPYTSPEYRSAVENQWWFWAYLTNVYIALKGTWTVAIGAEQYWTLAVEEQFYIVWPLLVFLTPRRHLQAVCVAVIVMAFGLRLYCVLTNANPITASILTPMRMDSLALGAILAVAARDPGQNARVVGWSLPAAVVSGVLLCGVFAYDGRINPYDPLMQTAGFTLLALFFGSVLVAAQAGRLGALIGGMLTGRFLRLMGKYSYGIYIYHEFVLDTIVQPYLRATSRLHLPWLASQFGYFAVCFAISVTVAALSWRWFESPILSLKRYFQMPDEREAGPRTPASATT